MPSEPVAPGRPTIRQNRWTSVTIVPLKKPTLLFSSDDPMSKRQMQLELTVTPIMYYVVLGTSTRHGRARSAAINCTGPAIPTVPPAASHRPNSPIRPFLFNHFRTILPASSPATPYDGCGYPSPSPAPSGRTRSAHKKHFDQTKPISRTSPLNQRLAAVLAERPPSRALLPPGTPGILTSRGRDGGCPPPPAQIRTSGFPAYGSYLGWVAAKRTLG